MDGHTITLFAQDDHVMPLGWLYDIRTFRDCGVSLFNVSTLPTELIGPNGTEGQTCSKAWNYEESETLKSTLSNFKVSAHLKLSVGIELYKVSGQSVLSILQEAKTSNRQTRISLTYMKRTKCDLINLNADQFVQLINRNALNYDNATHVVIGRSFGNTAMVTAEFLSNYISETTKAKGKIKGGFDKIKDLINFGASGAANSDSEISSFDEQIRFKVFGDFSENIGLFTDIDSVRKFIREIDNYLKNDRVIEYKLISIKSLRENIFNFPENLPFTLTIPNEHICTKLLELFDVLNTKYLEFDDCIRDILNKKIFVDQSYQKEIDSFKTDLKAIREEYKIGYRNIILGPQNLDKLLRMIDLFKEELDSIVDKYSKTQTTTFLKFANELNLKGIIVVKDGFLLTDYLPNDKEAFIMETNENMRNSNSWKQNMSLLNDLIKHHKSKLNKIIFIYVENDSQADSVVRFYQENRQLKFSDYRRDFLEKNFAKLGTYKIWANQPLIPSGALKYFSFAYKIDCPNARAKNCSKENRSWICYNCESNFKNANDVCVCCNCGGYYQNTDLTFKCGDPNHGFDFVRHEENYCTIS